MPGTEKSVVCHVRAAVAAALLLALCQVMTETLVIAARSRGFLLGPAVLFPTTMYDFCVKLFLLLPGATEWFRGGALDRFLPAEFSGKLVLGGSLVVPNLLVMIGFGLLIGCVCYVRRRPARLLSVLWGLVALALVVHAVSVALAVPVPSDWTARVIARNIYRVFVWARGGDALIVLGIASAAAVLIARLGSVVRWVVSVGMATAAVVALVTLVPATPASSRTTDASTTGAPQQSAGATVENVLLISIDSLRADRLGCYGNERNTSPTLDRLAADGVRFANAMSSTSWTLPSHMSLLTGRDVLSHGVITVTDSLSADVPTLAESLQQAGIATGGIVAGWLLKSHYGFGRGFDHYDDRTIPATTRQAAQSDEPAPAVTELAIKWLRERRGQRFFLFLHFWDVHYDYIPPPPYDTMFDPDYRGSITGENFYRNPAVHRGMPQRDLEHLLALYDGEIRWVDDHIGRLLAVIDELGIAGRTAVIVTADHGDEFFEHGYKGHHRTLYREVMQVPLIMRLPGVKPGLVVQEPVSLVDLMPTILDLVGLGAPRGLNGASVMPVIEGRDREERGAVYGWLCRPEGRRNCQAMQHSAMGTLIHRFEPLQIEFYGPTDYAQSRNIARSSQWRRREQLALLTERLNAHWEAYRDLRNPQTGRELDGSTRERLRALGYVD